MFVSKHAQYTWSFSESLAFFFCCFLVCCGDSLGSRSFVLAGETLIASSVMFVSLVGSLAVPLGSSITSRSAWENASNRLARCFLACVIVSFEITEMLSAGNSSPQPFQRAYCQLSPVPPLVTNLDIPPLLPNAKYTAQLEVFLRQREHQYRSYSAQGQI